MFSEHSKQGTGTRMGDIERHFEKLRNEGVFIFSIFLTEMEHNPGMIGTMFSEHGACSKLFELILLEHMFIIKFQIDGRLQKGLELRGYT
jgi:hypothetical protein